MLIDIINKILLIFLVMSVLNIFRNVYYFIQAWVKSKSGIPQEKYKLSIKGLYVLAISIGYLIMSIIDGVLIN